MSTTFRIPTPLRRYTGGAGEIRVEAVDLAGALASLAASHPELVQHVLDERGEPRPFVNLFVDGVDARAQDGLATRLADTSTVVILPAVAGGSGKDRRLAELRASIPQIEPAEARGLQDAGGVLIDVREPDEVAQGSPTGALRLGRGFLELRVEDAVADHDAPVAVLCAGGVRSLFAAESLAHLGYRDVRSVRGGFDAWKGAGLPVETPRVLDRAERERYARHLLMPEVGEAGQVQLLKSRVLLVGAGGLGSPASIYLAAAGVGRLTIVDDDVVDRSNLQRQILHTDDRVGDPKVASAAATLKALNPAVEVIGVAERLTARNARELFRGHDVVVDGSDNFTTRYLVNDACVELGIPNVHGSVFRFDGQVSVFSPRHGGPCYRCLYPSPPPPELAPSCAEAGVLGVLPGVVGTLEAVETIKLLLGIGEPLVGRLLSFDALAARFDVLTLRRDPGCRWCAGEERPELEEVVAGCQIGEAS